MNDMKVFSIGKIVNEEEDYIYNKPTIVTARIVIRPMTIEDVTDLKEWMPDKSIYTYWGKGPGKTEKNPELLFEKENKPTKSFHLGISDKDLDTTIRFFRYAAMHQPE